MRKTNLIVLCLVVLIGAVMSSCVLTITSFTVPDTAETGEVIELVVIAEAVDQEDGASKYGLALQIPETWEVLSAKSDVTFHSQINEDPAYAGLFSAETGYKVWGGTASESGTEGRTVTATVKVLTGNFDGLAGSTQNYMLKVIAGAYRDYVWASDDPLNAFNFASITADKYTEFITVTKVVDSTAPASVTQLLVERSDTGTDAMLSWHDYDENSQKDVVEYHVYKSTSPFSDVTGMAYETVRPGTQYYLPSGLISGLTYYFAVTAVDEIPNENKSVVSVPFTAPSSSIEGMVFEWKCTGFFSPCQEEKVGINDVSITAENQTQDYSATVFSDYNGDFVFYGLPNDTYTLTFTKSGFGSSSLNVEVSGNQPVLLADTELHPLKYTAEEFQAERDRWDVDKNNQIGLPEAIHALQVVAGIRENN